MKNNNKTSTKQHKTKENARRRRHNVWCKSRMKRSGALINKKESHCQWSTWMMHRDKKEKDAQTQCSKMKCRPNVQRGSTILNRDKMHTEREQSTHLTYAKMSNNIAKKTTKPQWTSQCQKHTSYILHAKRKKKK